MKVKYIIKLGLLFSGLLWASVWIFFRNDEYILYAFAPNLGVLFLFSIASVSITFVRSSIIQVFLLIWLIWPVAGTYFSIGHFFQNKLWAPLYFEDANLIFLSNVLIMIFSVVIFQLFFKSENSPKFPNLYNSLQMLPLFLFPIFYAISLIATGPTILTSNSVVDSIYAVNRGPLYPFRLTIVLSLSYFGLRLFSDNTNYKIFWLFAIFFTIFASVLDGKRDMAVLGILSIIFIQIAYFPERSASKLFLVSLGAVLGYGLIANLRAGNELELTTWLSFATIIGVEYRDYVHSIFYWSPEWIETLGYDFWRSSVAMLVNGKILEVFGVDKDSWVFMDSARSWQKAFQQDVGIRVGLVAELHFQVGAWSHVLFAFIGGIVVFTERFVIKGKGQTRVMAALLCLATLQLAVFSQASAMFGYVLTTVYILICLLIWRKFSEMILKIKISSAKQI